jgi:3-hydroxyacyl-CoA dehydrogenase
MRAKSPEFAFGDYVVSSPLRRTTSSAKGARQSSTMVRWCTAALDLLVRGVSDFESIDRTWMITLQTGMGPCGTMDRLGLGGVHHVATLMDEANSPSEAPEYARYIDERFIEPGHLGVTSGQGFYSYPNPTFAQPGFI